MTAEKMASGLLESNWNWPFYSRLLARLSFFAGK